MYTKCIHDFTSYFIAQNHVTVQHVTPSILYTRILQCRPNVVLRFLFLKYISLYLFKSRYTKNKSIYLGHSWLPYKIVLLATEV